MGIFKRLADLPDHDCGTSMGDGCEVCAEVLEDADYSDNADAYEEYKNSEILTLQRR